MQYYVYILTNKTNEVLYIGMTNDLVRRIYEHREKRIEGFTAKYNVTKLVYYEETSDVRIAIQREKTLKKWARKKKEWLISRKNPCWEDLAQGFF